MVPNPKSNDAAKTTASTPKSSSSDGASSGVINSTQFVEFILELVQSEDLREEFEKYLLDPKNYDIGRARGALGAVIADMFKIPLNNTLRPFATNFLSLQRKNDAIDQKLTAATEKLQHVVADKIDIATLMRECDAKRRFSTEFYKEKRRIAEYVTRTYFGTEFQCFVQASTTALHIVEELQNNRLGRGSVIHTNSFAIPYLMLGIDYADDFNVYPVSGQIKDPKCAGWLYSAGDSKADQYLRELFRRPEHKVTTAFITPQFLDANGVGYFWKGETVNLVRAILESETKVVVLTPGPRILPGRAHLPATNEIPWAEIILRPTDNTVALDWIIAGDINQLNSEQTSTFRAKCEQKPSRSAEYLTC
jgi:hypothetical protein